MTARRRPTQGGNASVPKTNCRACWHEPYNADVDRLPTVQMARDPVSDTSPTESTDLGAERSLNVCIRPYDLDFAEYHGSRAQLEAEGVIPPGIHWPKGGASLSWEAGKLEYSLRRIRPEGMKGPQKLWLAGDWWSLRFQLKARPNQGVLAIQKKIAELAAEFHRQSPEGRREWDRQWKAYWKTCEDKAFQTFKTKFIPERKKPGRLAKVRAADSAHAADLTDLQQKRQAGDGAA